MTHRSASGPEWADGVYVESWMEDRWNELSPVLKRIAAAEFSRSNKAISIQKNHSSGIIVLAFEGPPAENLDKEPGITFYRAHENGNYCYEGTACTIRDNTSGHILAFLEPNHLEDSV